MSVSSGSSGAMRAIGPSISGDKASVSLETINCLGGELSLNPQVTLVPGADVINKMI